MDIADKLDRVKTAHAAGERDVTLGQIKAIIQEAPALGPAWLLLCSITTALDEVSTTRLIANLVHRQMPGDLQSSLQIAGKLAGLGQIEEARNFVAPFGQSHPKDPALHHLLGTLMSQLGKPDVAEACYRRTLMSWPTAGQTWLSLAAEKEFAPGDPDISAMEKALADSKTSASENQSSLNYALGKAYLDTSRTDEAFGCFQTGAKLAGQSRPNDISADTALVKAICDVAGDGPVSSNRFKVEKPPRMIFVVGMPRSGSTLLEQMLSSHTAVAGGGEINFMRHLLQYLDGGSPEALASLEQNPRELQRLRDMYLHLVTERFGPEGAIVDKSLGNTRYIGLIKLLFPHSPVIWMRRDPVDTAWSCFRTHFNVGLGWTFDQRQIAQYHKNEDRLHKYWSEREPDRILSVQYEQLVEGPQKHVADILEHAGLFYEEGPLAFHKTARPVVTASVGQVRQPLYKHAIGSAGLVDPWMEPFRLAYFEES